MNVTYMVTAHADAGGRGLKGSEGKQLEKVANILPFCWTV
jgi:hypothetical protein